MKNNFPVNIVAKVDVKESLLLRSMSRLEIMQANKIQNKRRRHQFLACRWLVKVILTDSVEPLKHKKVEIKNDIFGAPQIKIPEDSSLHISFSHINEWVAVSVSLYSTGIDLVDLADGFKLQELVDSSILSGYSNLFKKKRASNVEAAAFWSSAECFFKVEPNRGKTVFNYFPDKYCFIHGKYVTSSGELQALVEQKDNLIVAIRNEGDFNNGIQYPISLSEVFKQRQKLEVLHV